MFCFQNKMQTDNNFGVGHNQQKMTEIPVQHESSRPQWQSQMASRTPPRVSTPPRVNTPPKSQTPPRFFTLPRNHRERPQNDFVREIPIHHFSSNTGAPQTSQGNVPYPRPDYPGAPVGSQPQTMPTQSYTSHATAQEQGYPQQGQNGQQMPAYSSESQGYPPQMQGYPQHGFPPQMPGYPQQTQPYPNTQPAQSYSQPVSGYPQPTQAYPQTSMPQQYPQGSGYPQNYPYPQGPQIPQPQGQQGTHPSTTQSYPQQPSQRLPQCPPPDKKEEMIYNIPIIHEAKESTPTPPTQPQQTYQTWPRQPKPERDVPMSNPESTMPGSGVTPTPERQTPKSSNGGVQHEAKDHTDSPAPSQQTQHVQMEESRSRSNTPVKEQKTVKTPLDMIHDILCECQQYEERVTTFKGSKKDKEYKLLEEMLTRSLLKLDGIESGQDLSIRQARKAAVKEIQSYLDQLELKAFSEEMPSSSQPNTNTSDNEQTVDSSEGDKDKDHKEVKEMVLDSEVAC